MKVSVVIPTYNRSAYLAEAIASVLAQTFQDFEIVIVDDGSTDDTAQMVKALAEPRIRYLEQDHRGVSAALNIGWRAARGDFIARLDSDDLWLPTLLQELVTRLEEDKTRGAAYARARGMNAQGELLTQLVGTSERFPGETLKSLVYGDFVSPMAVVIRRSALDEVGGYDESLIGNEDWDVWIRIARHYGIAYVAKILALYRFHAQNLTRTNSDRMERLMQDRVRVLDKFFSSGDIPPSVAAIKPIAYRNVYLDWAIRYLERRQWKNAWQAFERAVALSPSRLTFVPRAFAIAGYYLVLSKTRWGVWLVDQVSARNRKRPAVI